MDSASVTLDGWYWPSHMPVTSLSTLGSSARQSYSDRNLVRAYREAPTFLGPRGDSREKFLRRRATPGRARVVWRVGIVCRVGLTGLLGCPAPGDLRRAFYRLPDRLEIWLSPLIWCCSISAACSSRYRACTPCWNSPASTAKRSCGGAG